ncbi:hypothetical protein [Mycobacteroides immunogenum]|nr:hypothetical protein [Mycobacteroides immunogenum]
MMEDTDNRLQMIDVTRSDTGETSIWFMAWGDDSRVDVVYPRVMLDTNDYPAYQEAQKFIEREGLVWKCSVPVIERYMPLEPELIEIRGKDGAAWGNAVWEVYFHPRYTGRNDDQLPRARKLIRDDGSQFDIAALIADRHSDGL